MKFGAVRVKMPNGHQALGLGSKDPSMDGRIMSTMGKAPRSYEVASV